ncbi:MULTISPECIES: hypothetical protein [unclassified Pseudomonas]|jgi:hypothetical protein|uniref:hypothetical protein n=1 Tax=unclassified Pseudomonas TaxID=196821 RepID=UPI000AB36190|nr:MULTISPECIES: hypothetical protein [unclassified Pseudomonas]WLI35694.1 hypothetical protein PSH80_04895 [Pseudomonas sp. FP818]
MKQIERDFITLFNCLWYQDFPVEVDAVTNRAGWTIHVGLVIRECAKLLGARAYFEQSRRTDAVLRFPDKSVLSHVEWEWDEPHNEKVKEITKLLEQSEPAAFSTFISYSTISHLPAAIERVSNLWAEASKPLIFFVVTFEQVGRDRHFLELQTHVFSHGKHKRERTQPALPWQINRARFNNVDEDK